MSSKFQPTNVLPRTGYRWFVLGAATLSQASAAFVTQGLAVLAGFIQANFHLSGMQVGFLFTASSLVPMFTLLFVGHLLDLKSERMIVGVGSTVIAMGLVMAAFTSSFLVLLFALLIIGAGYSTIQPGGSRSVSNWFRNNELGVAMGIRQAGLPLGGAAAGVFIPYFVHNDNLQGAFLLCLLVVLVGGMTFYAIYKAPDSNRSHSQRPVLSPRFVFKMLKKPWMLRITIFGGVLVGIQYGIVVNLMLFLRDAHHVALNKGAQILALAQLCGGGGRIALAALGDFKDNERHRFFPVYLSFFATAFGLIVLLALPVSTPVAVLTIVSVWLGFFGMGWYGPWVAYIAYVSPKENLGLALGIAMAINQIAIVTTPPFLGKLYDLTGSYSSVWLFMILAQAGALVAFNLSSKYMNAGCSAGNRFDE
jgi:MFS family permease